MTKLQIFRYILLFFSTFFITSCQNKSLKDEIKSNEIDKASVEHENHAYDEHGLSHSIAIIKTVHGQLQLKFYIKQAPNTSKRIIKLIRDGFYDGLEFHRVVNDFIIQTGSPDGSLAGGSGMRLKAELSDLKHIRGSVSMARRANDIDSADSQFFITLKASEELDGKYTVFAQVFKGFEVLDKIKLRDRIITMEYISN